MNIKQVGYFVAVFETKSFTAAAHQRNVTVQAISKSISELEQFFNVQLFERGNSGVKPTQAGRSFYAKARLAVEAYREVENFDPSGCDLTVSSASGPQTMPELSIGLCAPALDNEDKLYRGLSALIMRSVSVRVKFCTVHPGFAQQQLEQGGSMLCLRWVPMNIPMMIASSWEPCPRVLSSPPTIRSARGPL